MHKPGELKPPSPEVRVRFANLDREAGCEAGETIFHSARRAGVRIVGACGGRGVCGSCIVHVESGEFDFTRPDAAPTRAKEWVRACLVRPKSDCVVRIAPRSIAQVVRAEVGGRETANIAPEPAVHAHDVVLAPASMTDSGADAGRVIAALRGHGATRFGPRLRRRHLRRTAHRHYASPKSTSRRKYRHHSI